MYGVGGFVMMDGLERDCIGLSQKLNLSTHLAEVSLQGHDGCLGDG